ncbi:Speckle-type POZ protein [Hordeum vulgare]|nr:Speckle-type POZ protein [Hordeum vulgare]
MRFGLGTFNNPEDAASAYDVTTWRLRRPRRRIPQFRFHSLVLAFDGQGKEVVPPLDKAKEAVSPLVKVIFGPKLEALPLPLDFTKQFLLVPIKFSLKMNTDCSWRVTVKVVDDRVILDQGWATFDSVHHVRIRYMLTFMLLTSNTMKVIVFNNDDVEVVTKCKKHDEAFT